MVSRSILRNTLFTQLTINQGKPPDHDRRSATFDNYSSEYKLTANHGGL